MHLTATIEAINDIPAHYGDLFVIMRLGDRKIETPFAKRSGDHYVFESTSTFEDTTGQGLPTDIQIEVVNQEYNVVAFGTIHSWQKRLVNDKIALHVEVADVTTLEKIGRLNLRLRTTENLSEKQFDRLEIHVSKIYGLSSSVGVPQLFVKYGQVCVELKKSTVGEEPGEWVFNDTIAVAYTGERELAFLCRTSDTDELKGKSRYDVMELLRRASRGSTKGAIREVGRLPICNDGGSRIGEVLVGLELWNTTSFAPYKKHATLIERLQKRINVDETLCDLMQSLAKKGEAGGDSSATPTTKSAEDQKGQLGQVATQLSEIQRELNECRSNAALSSTALNHAGPVHTKTALKKAHKKDEQVMERFSQKLDSVEEVLYRLAYHECKDYVDCVQKLSHTLSREVRRGRLQSETSPRYDTSATDSSLHDLLATEEALKGHLRACVAARDALAKAQYFQQVAEFLRQCADSRDEAQALFAKLDKHIAALDAQIAVPRPPPQAAASVNASDFRPVIVQRSLLPIFQACCVPCLDQPAAA